MREKKVAMIVLNYNGLDIKFRGKGILRHFMETVSRVDYDNYKVVILDDCSTDNSVKYMRSFGSKKVDVMTSDKNLNHFSRQNNIAIRYALKKYDPDYILLAGNDLIFTDSEWLKKMISVGEQKGVGIVGTEYSAIPDVIKYTGGRAGGRAKVDADFKDVDSPLEACYLIKREVIDKNGLFDEKFLTSGEGTDYSIRARCAGFRTVVCTDVSVIHLEGFSTIKNKDPNIRKLRFYGDRMSMLHFINKHYDPPEYARKLRTIIIYFVSCVFLNYGASRTKGIFGYTLRDHKLWRIKVSFEILFRMLINGEQNNNEYYMKQWSKNKR